MKYRVVDHVVQSEFPLPELARATDRSADWTIACSGELRSLSRSAARYHHWRTPRGYRWATFWRDGGRRVLHFARTAQFVVDDSRRLLTCAAIGRTAEDAWRPVLLNQVLPLLLSDRRLVLHASAVATPQGAMVFVGAPGRGKSTLAVALALRGFPLITDDFLVIDQTGSVPLALPSGLAPRLWPDSLEALLPGRQRQFPLVSRRSDKRRIAVGLPLASEPLPVAAIWVVMPPQSVSAVDDMSPAAAVMALTASTFVDRIDERDVVRATFERVTALVARAPVRGIARSAEFSHLERLCSHMVTTGR